MGIGNRSSGSGYFSSSPGGMDWEDNFAVEEPTVDFTSPAARSSALVGRRSNGQVQVGESGEVTEDDSGPELPEIGHARRKQYGRLCDLRSRIDYLINTPGIRNGTFLKAVQVMLLLEKREAELLALDAESAGMVGGKIPVQFLQQIIVQYEKDKAEGG